MKLASGRSGGQFVQTQRSCFFSLPKKWALWMRRAGSAPLGASQLAETVRAKSPALQGFLYAERWPRGRHKRNVQISVKRHLPPDRRPVP